MGMKAEKRSWVPALRQLELSSCWLSWSTGQEAAQKAEDSRDHGKLHTIGLGGGSGQFHEEPQKLGPGEVTGKEQQ